MSQQAQIHENGARLETSTDDFLRLLEKEFKPRTDEAKTAVEEAIHTLAQQALSSASLIGDDVIQAIEAMIASIDDKLSAQVNAILHHQEFQQLEGAWRGLHYLVNNTETDQFLKIRYLNINKADLAKQLKRYKGAAWDQSPIFKKVYEVEYGQFGGEPYGCVVGDYYFDHSPKDVEMLGEIAKISAAAHVPFLSAASPDTFQMDSWAELSNPRDLTKIFSTPDYAAWRALRESEDSKYIGLTMPRFLARELYGSKTNPVEEFAFEEAIGDGSAKDFVWANAAYAMATNINRSFKEWGWCSRIRGVESGGAVPELPTYTFPTDDGGVDMACPTEVAISDRREAELSQSGFLPLIHKKNSNMAAFIGAQSLHKPTEYDDPDATANARLAARLGEPSFGFSAKQVESNQQGHVALKGFGLLGPFGAMPLHVSEQAYLGRRTGSALEAFINLFQHRMALLFFKAWAQTRLDQRCHEAKDNSMLLRVAKLSGQFQGLFDRSFCAKRDLRYRCLPYLASQGKGIEGLVAALAAVLRAPVKVEQLKPRWVVIPLEYQTKLGRCQTHLGAGIPIGARAQVPHWCLTVVIGKVEFASYINLLGQSRQKAELEEVIQSYLTHEYDFHLAVLVTKSSAPEPRVSANKTVLGNRLGRTMWLGHKLSKAEGEFRVDLR